MAKLSEQLKALFGEWADNIRKEIDRIEMDNTAKVDEILALRNAIRENEDELSAIESNVRAFATEVLEVAEDADNARDYAAYVADTLDEIEDYYPDEDEDEDDEPIAYCDNCGEAIWEEDDIVDGEYGEYCSEDCRAEAEDDEDEDIGEDDEADEEDAENEANAE